MTPESYRASPFLDARIVRGGPRQLAIGFDEILACKNLPATNPTYFVFHTAFCCSTLLSRRLDALQCFLVLREPHSLFELVSAYRFRGTELLPPIDSAEWSSVYRLVLYLLSRRYVDDQPVVVKPSDGCNLFMGRLLAGNSGNRGIFLYSTLERFLTSILKLEMRDEWAKMRARELTMDQYRKYGRIDVDPATLNRWQTAALVWALHMQAYRATLDEPQGEYLRSLDSENFVANQVSVLGPVIRYFGVNLDGQAITRAIDADPIAVNAKAPAERYDPGRRERDYLAARSQYAEQIEAGMAWARQRYGEELTESPPPQPLLSYQ